MQQQQQQIHKQTQSFFQQQQQPPLQYQQQSNLQNNNNMSADRTTGINKSNLNEQKFQLESENKLLMEIVEKVKSDLKQASSRSPSSNSAFSP